MLLALALCAGVLLGGCSRDILDVNRRTLMFAIGVDYDEKAHEYAVTYVFSNLTGGQGGSSGGIGGASSPAQEPLTVRTETGTTAEDAISRLEDELPAQVFYGSARLLVMGEGLLQNGAQDAIYTVAALHEMPWRAYVAATREDARAFLSAPEVLKQRPVYSIFQSRAIQDLALRPGYLFSTVSHASDARFAALLPLFTYAQQRVDFLGQVVLRGGREVSVVPTSDASLVVPLLTSGPEIYRVDLPGWSKNPVILGARSAKASVRTAPDGSVLVRLHLLGFVYGRAQLVAAGFTDTALEQRIGSELAPRLTDRLLTLAKAGVDPRALADMPYVDTGSLVVRTDVYVTLDRNRQVS